MGNVRRNDVSKLRLVRPEKVEPIAPRNLFLNPFTDMAFTKCPGCERRTKVRKYALVIHIDPMELLVLNMSCRYCEECSLLIVDTYVMESLMVAAFKEHNPDIIGNEYVVMGTLPRALWRSSSKQPMMNADIARQTDIFEDEWSLELPDDWSE